MPSPIAPTLPRAECAWDADGVLKSHRFGDGYFSDHGSDGGLAEKRHVFVAGCELSERWAGAAVFTVAELGFGSGLNFLATWAAWREGHLPGARLHYIAVEGFPLSAAEMREACARRARLSPMAEALARAYPEPQRGFQRVRFAGDDSITLTLLFGDAAECLRGLEAQVDAWFLDGFAPGRNPDMWSPAVMAEIARLSRTEARLATYTAAGEVRRNLKAAGFEVARVPGFGRKREMLRATFHGPVTPVKPRLEPWFALSAPRRPGHAAVVGAGIAGAATCHALRARGWDVTVIDRHGAAAMEASGNPVGVLMPRLTADDGIEGRIHAAAWRHALQTYAAIDLDRCGVLQIARDDADATRLGEIAARGVLLADDVSLVNAAAATALAGCEITRPALFFPHGGTVDPRALCRTLIGDTPVVHMDVTGVDRVKREVGADIVVFANALGATAIVEGLPLTARRGQITAVAAHGAAPRVVLAADATITPPHGGRTWLGATFDWTTDTTLPQAVRNEDHARNIAAIVGAFPGAIDATAQAIDGRASVRCMTPDHLPIAGPLPDRAAYLSDYAGLRHGQNWVRYPPARYVPDVYVLTGLGARGLVTAPLMAEVLASHVMNEPWPLARELVTALHPARFLVRDLKRLRA